MNPFLGYGTALVLPSTNVNLSSKSGQCSSVAHGVGVFYSEFYDIEYSGLQLKPFLGYGTALVLPSTNVNLSSKSGQCSSVAHGVGVFYSEF